jgi:hypothetical protein
MGQLSLYQALLWARERFAEKIYHYQGNNSRKIRAMRETMEERMHTLVPYIVDHTSLPTLSTTLADVGLEFAPQFAPQNHYNPFFTHPPSPTCPYPTRDFQGRLLVLTALCDHIRFSGIEYTIPRYAILLPSHQDIIEAVDELILVQPNGLTVPVKVIRNHGTSQRLRFSYVLECIDLRYWTPTRVILLAATTLVHSSFKVEEEPNLLFLGSTGRCEVVEEEEYEKYAVSGTMAHAYYRTNEDFSRPAMVEFSDDEYDGSLFTEDEENAEHP